MSLTPYFVLTFLLIGAEWLYIRLARSCGWFDLPNVRSAHTDSTTVRGGGIVFYLAVVGAIWIGKLDLLYFSLGLTAIAVVSFWYDVRSLPKRYRFAVHVLAVGLLLNQEGLLVDHWYVVAGSMLAGVAIVNAYNFMDGINGMTALYSLVTVGTLWYCQAPAFDEGSPLISSVIIALMIFSWVNLRRQAICFAGDVGSMTMGFIVLYGLLESIYRTHTYLPVLFLAVYGVDSIGTMSQRLYCRENIFQAHRMHLFQLLVYRAGWSHLRVSVLYAIIQAGINILIVIALHWSPMGQLVLAGVILGGLLVSYLWAKNQLGRKKERFAVSKPLPLHLAKP